MKGKKSYPVACKTKDTVMSAAKARKSGGRVENMSAHSPKALGDIDGAVGPKHAGKSSRGVHGKPLMSAAAGKGSK